MRPEAIEAVDDENDLLGLSLSHMGVHENGCILFRLFKYQMYFVRSNEKQTFTFF